METLQWFSTDQLSFVPQLTPNHVAQLYTFCTTGALLWLAYRAWQTFKHPLPELIEKLGLEVPIAPDVSLAGIKPDSITLYWKAPDHHNTVVKHIIQVNGVIVGESARAETSVTVTGLKPDHLYNVRVIATNASSFYVPSRIIRLKTSSKPSSSTGPGDDALPNHANSRASGQNLDDSPSVQAHGTYSGPVISVPTAPAMAREHSGSQTFGKRLGGGRRHSPASTMPDQAPLLHSQSGHGDQRDENVEPEQTLEELTKDLETLRRETEELDLQVTEEDEEYENSRTAMAQERDQLKQYLKEKEDASNELRKQAASLDRANRSAQSKKAAKEKILHQKEGERRKMQQDMNRWNSEIADTRAEIRRIDEEKAEVEASTARNMEAVRQEINDFQTAVKGLEEDIRVIGIQIKDLEEGRKKTDGGEDDEDVRQRERSQNEADARWEARLRGLQTQHAASWNTFQQSELNLQNARDRLAWWNTRRLSNSAQFTTSSALDFDPSGKKTNQKRSRQRSSRTSTLSSPIGGFTTMDSRFPNAPVFHSISSISPSFSSPSPFFNMNNGMAFSTAPDQTGLHGDADFLTGGAPLSPTADALLPANLLGDEDPRLGPPQQAIPSFPETTLTGPGPSPDNNFQIPGSPESSQSRSPSVFSSPRDSLNNLHTYQTGSDGVTENEQKSIRSTSGSFGAIGDPNNTMNSSRRFSNLFSLNRQRGKTLPNEPPVLGSLKAGQSQSFPRNIEQEPGSLDPIGTRRRRGSHTGGWINPMTNFLNRNAPATSDIAEGNGPAPSRTPASRRRPFNMFSAKYDQLDLAKYVVEPSSPRPSSAHSRDVSLPRPSTDSQPFGWPASEGLTLRGSPLGADWSVPGSVPELWSRGPSRRQSMQYGSSSSLSLGISSPDAEVIQNSLKKHISPSAPIGTRAEIPRRPTTPKLNPAAPTFKTIFSRSDAKKAEKAEKAAEKAAEKEKERIKELEPEPNYTETSPPDNRISRDARSIATTESIAESNESLDRSTSGTPSEAPGTPSSTTTLSMSKDKESLIQRITRKSSSSKFNIPWSKDKTGLFSKNRGEPSTPGELEEDASSEAQLGKSFDSVTSSPQNANTTNRSSISWSNIMRKNKKGDKAASEASERASETGDDDE
ncbi:MAG: hypothetical protein M1827_001238 [Pycnora praestabilis]|nr:MAG: hypothetical protein M1827_001238 [Pycnora praestabilis]